MLLIMNLSLSRAGRQVFFMALCSLRLGDQVVKEEEEKEQEEEEGREV